MYRRVTRQFAFIVALSVTYVTNGQDPNSVVDYYLSTGRDPSFPSRKADSEQLFPNEKYIGSKPQNEKLRNAIELGDRLTMSGENTSGIFRVPTGNASFMPPEPFRTHLAHPAPSRERADCQPFYESFQGLPNWNNGYLTNATTACEVTGSGPKASAVRHCLQDEMLHPRSSQVNGAELRSIHETCYDRAGCIGSPAPVWAWSGVNNMTLPRFVVSPAINAFGSCEGKPGVFESPKPRQDLSNQTLVPRDARNLSGPSSTRDFTLGVDYSFPVTVFPRSDASIEPTRIPSRLTPTSEELERGGLPRNDGASWTHIDPFAEHRYFDGPGPTPFSGGAKATEVIVGTGVDAWQRGMQGAGNWVSGDNCVPTVLRKIVHAGTATANAGSCATFGDGNSCVSAWQGLHQVLKAELWNNCISRE